MQLFEYTDYSATDDLKQYEKSVLIPNYFTRLISNPKKSLPQAEII